MKLTTAVFAATILFAGAAQAGVSCGTSSTAMLSSASEGVLVNTGSGFAPATSGAVLHTGDQVMVKGGGSAVLDYGHGDVSTVGGSSSAIVRGKPCGAVASIISNGQFSKEDLLGGALIAGGITAAIIATNQSNRGGQYVPSSP